jgi:hypothetical protein
VPDLLTLLPALTFVDVVLQLTNTTHKIQIRSGFGLRNGRVVINKQDVVLQGTLHTSTRVPRACLACGTSHDTRNNLFPFLAVSPTLSRTDGQQLWRSPNTSLLSSNGDGALMTPTLTTSYLAFSASRLQEGRTYVLWVSAFGNSEAARVRRSWWLRWAISLIAIKSQGCFCRYADYLYGE